MPAKKFFKKVGRNLQRTAGALTTSAGKSLGGVLGAAAGKAILSGIATYGPEVAEGAAIALKTGGRVPGGRNKAVHFIGHGSEYILPSNARPTKAQKAIVAKNKSKQKLGSFVYN
jgi:hypothetical protein